MYANFEWPIPPLYELPAGEEFRGHEPSLMILLSGGKMNCALSRFLPTHGIIEFLPARGRVNLDIPLADIQQLRLTRPLVLKRRSSEIDKRGGELAKPSERQPFRIQFTNGGTLEGETVGFESQAAGLFLYMVSYGDAVIRAFVPSSSIKEQQIGKPLGEILVAEQLVTSTQVRSALARQQELREQRIGDILEERRVISSEQLRGALERQRNAPMVRLGDALVESRMITQQQLDDALAKQGANRKKPLGEILVELGHIGQADLFRALSQKLGVPSVDLKKFKIDPSVLKLVPEALVREFNVVPLCRDGGSLVVAMENPLNHAPIERIRFLTQGSVTPVMASAEDIAEAIRAHFTSTEQDGKIEDLAHQLSAEVGGQDLEQESVKETDSTLVRLVNKMILDAHRAGASDIHVETNAGRQNVTIRFRRDGTLSEYLQLPSSFRSAIVSRLKIMASLDISERRRAQDGRIDFQQYGPARLEMRIATMPTMDGLEDVVLRLLGAGEPLPLAKLGLREPLLEGLRDLLGRSHGLILVCGPTGSGKTTTLHSLLGVLNAPERKIWTAEDPVEISQTGLRQVQVNARIGWTFATAMRAMLRSDPDVIMVGEMRDTETAATAVEASLTGHLVLSTLHTNSAPETVVRLLEMGMDPFSFADALSGVLAQRLARRLCEACRESHPLAADEASALAEEFCQDSGLQPAAVLSEWRERFGGNLLTYSSRGCEACRKTGYKGRAGLHELLIGTPDLRQLMQRRTPASELRHAAIRAGMRTLRQDGIEKVLAGVTDLHEVRATAA
ncbi:MAG TPA: ATPase, T2SS/T4P/T4SS family [Burkholderiales bacterium]|nr:ATPase, T2SS/T4P/T4SS family [Burkholderiales bacterium]